MVAHLVSWYGLVAHFFPNADQELQLSGDQGVGYVVRQDYLLPVPVTSQDYLFEIVGYDFEAFVYIDNLKD